MDKTVYIVHGFTASSNSNWFPWLKKQLENEGVHVVTPDMPDTADPHLEPWLDMLRTRAAQMDSTTVFVGHSLGCVTALRYILETGIKIKGAVLVSGFIQNNPMKEQRIGISEFVEPALNVPLLKELIAERVVIAAQDDDIVPVEATRHLARQLDAQLIELDKGGHFIDRDGYIQHNPVLEQVIKMLSDSGNDWCKSKGMIPVMKFDAAGLFVKDMEKMVPFYRDVMRMKCNWSGGKYAELFSGEMRLIMYSRADFEKMISKPLDYPPKVNGTLELSFSLPHFEDVDKEFDRVVSAGARPVFQPANMEWGQRTSYVADPDGNLIEIGSFNQG